jgi:hypothetical protein
MKNIATPILRNQTNGSFAENEINKHMISRSYHEQEHYPEAHICKTESEKLICIDNIQK